jgi:hypothetical protein
VSLVWQQTIEYKALKAPQDFCYWIQFPGLDISNPTFHVYKGLPTDLSCTAIQSGTMVIIGEYATLTAAQAACQTDAFPPGSVFLQVPPLMQV